MEQIVQHTFNPRIERVVKSFQTAAGRSLSGPGRDYLTALKNHEEYRKHLVVHPTLKIIEPDTPQMTELGPYYTSPPLSSPFFIQTDSSRGEKSETVLEGETIACFIVGGEKRLCLPQILNSVLRDFCLQDINSVCDDLHIFCSRCSPEQLEILKISGILPPNARSCGLITKTDAERLCNALLYRSPEKNRDPPSLNSFKVYHECFGKCKGIFSPEQYVTPNSKCIQCCDCSGMFSPQKFVCHSHKSLENNTCHWGFDSANWRSYLLLAKDQDFQDQLQQFLDDLKIRFDVLSRYKRKESPCSEPEDGKKRRYDENTAPSKVFEEAVSCSDSVAHLRQMSAFRPWSPSLLNILKEGKVPLTCRDGVPVVLPSYLQTGPPVLANPDRVIPHTDSKMYKRTFAPNVSLAPQSYKKEPDVDEESEIDVTENGHDADAKPSKHTKAEDLSELELSSSDTDTSSLPSTPRGEARAMLFSPSIEELEIKMVQEALEGRVGDSQEVKERFMEDFLHLQWRREEKLQRLLKSMNELQQELESVKFLKQEKQRECSESKNRLQKEAVEFDAKILELTEENRRLRVELETQKVSRKTPDILRLKNKYRGEVEELQSQLDVRDEEQQQMKNEIAQLRMQLAMLALNNHEVKSPVDEDASRSSSTGEEAAEAAHSETCRPTSPAEKAAVTAPPSGGGGGGAT